MIAAVNFSFTLIGPHIAAIPGFAGGCSGDGCVGRGPAGLDGVGPYGRTGKIMKHVAAIVVCGLGLSACSSMPSWMSFELPKPAPLTTNLQFESVPAGAEARISTGGACRTPCAMAVAGDTATVTFTLPGYQPQTVPVRMVDSNEPRDPNSPAPPEPRMEPNPVYAELLPAAPPPVAKKKKTTPRPKKAVTAAAPRAAAPAPAGPAPAPAPAAAWPPPPAR